MRINAILEGGGYSTYIQDKDFGFTAFTEGMEKGFDMVEAGTRIIAILSRVYQGRPHCEVEARYPLIDDPSNAKQRLIVFRIDECNPTGFLKPIPYVDLVPYLSDDNALKEIVLRSVQTNSASQLIPSCVAPSGLADGSIEIDRVMQFLRNEDEQDFDKAFTYIFLGLFSLAGMLLIFEQLVNLWNWILGTNYYAIFDAETVFFLLIVSSALLIGGAVWQARVTARVIENSNLRREQLAELRMRVKERQWKSKSLIEGALAMATRNILSNKYRP